MEQKNNDRSVRGLFEADRRVDRAVTPPFATVMGRARAQRPFRFSIWTRVVVSLAAAGGVAAALWIMRVPAPAPVPASSDLTPQVAAWVEPRVEDAASQVGETVPSADTVEKELVRAAELRSQEIDPRPVATAPREALATAPGNAKQAGDKQGPAEANLLRSLGYVGSVEDQGVTPSKVVAQPERPLREVPSPSPPQLRPPPQRAQKPTPSTGAGVKSGRSASPGPFRAARVEDLARLRAAVESSESLPARAKEAIDGAGSERYAAIEESRFRRTLLHPLSTFSVDVDTASYTKGRRLLRQGSRPPADSIRIEEWINYFDYDVPGRPRHAPFAVGIEIASCPWNENHRLARIALQGRRTSTQRDVGANLVFLVDVSGSMGRPDKAPLVQQTLRELVGNLTAIDRIAIVTYSGASEVLLPSTSGSDQTSILDAIDRIQIGGSTGGALGILNAYRLAAREFIPGGVNRVILATDGDFNVGATSASALIESVQVAADRGISLTVLGYGNDNLNDALLEALTNRLNGFYAFIDGPEEARRVMGSHLDGSLITIAKDVKVQVEFNPAEVGAYRLIGYENRALASEDFNDDRRDSGDIGVGQSVTALYELIPTGLERDLPQTDALRYQPNPMSGRRRMRGETLWLKLRYKEPDSGESRLLELPAVDSAMAYDSASRDFKFAAGVAMVAMKLRGSQYATGVDSGMLRWLVDEGVGRDRDRHDFAELLDRALLLSE